MRQGPAVETRAGPSWAPLSNTIPSLLKDIPVIVAGLALFYGLMSLTKYWAGPVNTPTGNLSSPVHTPQICAVLSRTPRGSLHDQPCDHAGLWVRRSAQRQGGESPDSASGYFA